MSKVTIKLFNSIHNTNVNVRVFDGEETLLEKNTVYRIRKELCNVPNCKECTGYLKQSGENNPPIKENHDNIYILYSSNPNKLTTEELKEPKDNIKANYIHFNQLESKIMSSGLSIDEKSKLFFFIREIREDGEDEKELLTNE